MEALKMKSFTALALLVGSGFLVLGFLFVYTPVRAFEQSFDTMAMEPYKDGHYDSFRVYGLSYHTDTPSGPGRPTDLDFIARVPSSEVYIGIQVKNRMEAPKSDTVNLLIDICDI